MGSLKKSDSMQKESSQSDHPAWKIGIESLESRREDLCLNFARKCVKNKKLVHMFPENPKPHGMNTRHEERYEVQFANTDRLKNSPLIYMQKLLNLNHQNQDLPTPDDFFMLW